MDPVAIGPAGWLIGFLVAAFVVMPFATLAHELGHAAVALRVRPGPVTIQVGRPPSWFELVFERLTIRWSPLPMRGVPFAGLCLWRAERASPGTLFAIVLAGPLVTALLISVFILAAVACEGSASWITATWALSAFCCFTSFLINADPRPANEAERVNPRAARRDGPLARAAYRAWRDPLARSL